MWCTWTDSLAVRVRGIVTRRAEFVSPTGETETLHLSREMAWRLFGPQPSAWGWVRRWGTARCGCVRWPGTTRWLSHAGECVEHHALVES